MKEIKTEQRCILFAMLILTLYLSPLFILQENAHIRVHDNLDSNIAWYRVLARSGEMFGGVQGVIPQIINGMLSRNAFGTEFSIIVWLHYFFPTMIAYGLSQALTRFVAFFGMYLLLKKHLLPGEKWVIINIMASLAFALTPFWPSGMLSTLGMPLALWAFLNIRNGEGSIKDYVVLTLLPFYASIVLGFFFFLSAMGIFWLTDVIRKKRWNFPFLLSIIYMTFVFLLVEYRLVYSFLFKGEPNSRDEYFHAELPLWRVIRLTFKNYVFGHTHVMTVHTFVILPATLIAMYLVISKKLWKQEKIFVFLFGLNFILSLWYAFWFYEGWLPLTKKFHFMDTFNFARYHFLRPLVIYASFALALKIISLQGFSWSRIAKGLAIMQIILLCGFNDEIIYRDKPTVKEFYAEDLFQEIKEYIALPQEDYRVASIGIHPAIAQYNGFYTLDTYNNFYPLSYKHQFRKIIEKELEKNKTIKKYFDKWGGRCYIFTAQLGKKYMIKKDSKRHLKNLELNTNVFKEMGGRYIFSALPIDNAEQNQLSLERVFESKNSAWKIYLYKTF
ncbi:membrane protein [Bacillus sp. X1(2014)]|nr:membrane protein [Bacillus sp. X1(2014)]